MDMDRSRRTGCDDKQGSLPACGKLAAAYVPMQQSAEPKYKSADALARGTLFPGLDLPWKNVYNANAGPMANTPLGELMALNFVVQELGLYLDTHCDDEEALALYTDYVKLLEAGRKTYAATYGPITQTQVTASGGYSWICDPWPWEYCPRTANQERRGD